MEQCVFRRAVFATRILDHDFTLEQIAFCVNRIPLRPMMAQHTRQIVTAETVTVTF
jgi:hypothetical protein